jgi:LEA14-like dessication related protein
MKPSARHVWAVLLAMVALVGCASLTAGWQAPEVALVGLRIDKLAVEHQAFVATLKLRNPNDRTLPIKAMTYRLQIDGHDLAEGAGALERQIPAFGESLAEVEVVGNLAESLQLLPVLAIKQTPLEWTVSGTATIADGLLTLPYRYSGQVDPEALMSQALAVPGPGR